MMRILFVEKGDLDVEKTIIEMRKLGHKVGNNVQDPDVIFSQDIYNTREVLELKRKYPDALLATYCWDFYKWAWEGKHTFNWKSYLEFLKQCDLILVPSKAQQLRLKEMFELESVICECAIEVHKAKTKDGGYVLDPVRNYPEENLGWVEKACEELGIPCDHSEHKYSEEEFKEVVANCTFMTCGYREASTGGLTLMEGLYNGKVSLVSDSPYMGAKSYIGDFGYYFKYDDYEDLKRMLQFLWKKRPKADLKEARKHLEFFTPEKFGQRIIKELCERKKN